MEGERERWANGEGGKDDEEEEEDCVGGLSVLSGDAALDGLEAELMAVPEGGSGELGGGEAVSGRSGDGAGLGMASRRGSMQSWTVCKCSGGGNGRNDVGVLCYL